MACVARWLVWCMADRADELGVRDGSIRCRPDWWKLLLIAERRGPEGGETIGVGAVDHNLH
jgi:hypothetical protein